MTRPRIVVLDGYTLNPGDISWSPFEAIGDLEVHDRSESGEIVPRAAGAPIILTNKTVLNADTIANLPEMKYIGVLATGTNVVDLKAARQRGVPVTNVPGYGTDSVAQHVFALLLELVTHTAAHGVAVHEGEWVKSKDFCFTVAPISELAGKTLGIVGMGSIGRRVAEIGAAFGMKIAASQRTSKTPDPPGISITRMGMDELFAAADVLSLHCPLTDQTKHLVNAKRLALMKRTAILINTGRGPLIDEVALAAALKEERIAWAGLDVLSVEPPVAENPLLAAPHCLITPHIGWASAEARGRLMQLAADNASAFLAGSPKCVVN